MHLRILLPFQVFCAHDEVLRIVAETRHGSFGILPQRLDCVAALVPGILVFQTRARAEVLVAIDAGTLVKTGPEVLIAVRRAVTGADPGQLRALIERDYEALDESERGAHAAVAKLESGFLAHFASLHHG